MCISEIFEILDMTPVQIYTSYGSVPSCMFHDHLLASEILCVERKLFSYRKAIGIGDKY